MRRQKTFALIIHGARADLPSLRHLVAWVREKGHIILPYVTWEKGDGSRLAAEAVERGVDAVIAAGGDGTVNEVLNGMSGDTPLGIIPVGTANDFAKQVGIPSDPDHAMDVILQRKPMRIDTAEINGRRFLNVSTGGIGAEATAETPAEAKDALGPLAYAITLTRKLAGLDPQTATFTGDDFRIECKFVAFAVGNARATGGGTLITPRAKIRDGLMDLCIVEGMPRIEFAMLAGKIKRGEHLASEGVHYQQSASFLIESKRPVTVNVDGESMRLKRMEYSSRPGDLAIFLPHLPGESAEPEERDKRDAKQKL